MTRDDGDEVAFDVAVRHGLDERELADVFDISRAEVRVRRLRAVADVSLACLVPVRAAPAWLRARTLARLEER